MHQGPREPEGRDFSSWPEAAQRERVPPAGGAAPHVAAALGTKPKGRSSPAPAGAGTRAERGREKGAAEEIPGWKSPPTHSNV